MKNYNKLIMICAGLAPVMGVSAQQQANDSTVNRTVVVENQYNPEVMDAFKVNVLPKIEEPAVAKKQIDYATTLYPLSAFHVSPMEAISRDFTQTSAKRGYLRASYGNRNNTDIKGSYLWDITSRDRLDVMASFYGYSGEIGSGFDFDDVSGIPVLNSDKEWKHRFFRTDASLKYQHDFRKVSMNLGGAFASQVFSYMPDVLLPGSDNSDNSGISNDTYSFGHQHFTMGEGYIGFTSVKDALPVEFGIQTGFKAFQRKYAIPLMDDITEKTVHTEGYMSGAINEEQNVGVALSMDNMMYGEPLKDYSLIKLNPYYSLQNEDLSLRIGAHVDFQTDNGSGIKVAPDVKFAYTFAGSYVFYANITGGTRLNDFRTLNEVSPFWTQTAQLKTSYTPYDLSVGLKASPANGLGLNLFGGYRETRDELFTQIPMGISSTGGIYSAFAQAKAKVAYAGLSLDYAYRDLFDFGFAVNYYNWSIGKAGNNSESGTGADYSDGLLWLKPELLFGFHARAKVFDGMHAWLKYTYEGRKQCLGIKADPVNELNIGADYSFNERVNIFLSLNNILNKNYVTQTGYPVQGFNVMAGVSLNF